VASFPNATQAREQAQNYSIISGEIQAIETAIIAAITANKFTATVEDNTIMTEYTDSSLVADGYYNVWKGTVIDAVQTEQMNEIIKYFTDKGYSILRVTNTISTNTLKWVVSW